jgi:hemoglobin/transferrin/lactoferrin receptor protein
MSDIFHKKNTFKTTLISVAIAAACVHSTAYAEEPFNKPENTKVERIVVVGATTNTEITSEQLDKYQANDLEDIFRLTPSVTVGGSLGIAQKIYVRGLEDSMLNVTVDGAPQTSTLFHHIGRVAIEPELLESVEIQAGAGEATAGIGAVGGSIRFKTKSADDLLEKNERFGGIVKASHLSNSGHKESLTLYGKATDKIGFLASYVNVVRDNLTDGDGEEIPGTASDQSLAFVKINAEITENQALTLSYESRKEDGEFAKQTNWTPLAGDTLTQSWGERETIVLNHAWYLNDFLNLETTLYKTDSSFKRELFTWDASIETTGFDIRNTSDLRDHSITYGVERKVDKVNAHSYETFGGVYDEEGTVTGIYVQDHWQATDALLISFGLRQDSYKLDHEGTGIAWSKVDGVWIAEHDPALDQLFSTKKQDGISANIGLVYSITENINFSAGYAQALRGRQVADAFTISELAFNDNLAAETVVNNEVGLEYNDGTFLLKASAYLSVVNDVVFDKFKGSEGVYYENIGDLESNGFELVTGYQGDNFDLLISYNHNDIELNDAVFIWADETVILDGVDLEAYEYGGLGNGVGDAINVSVNYELNDQIAMGLNLNYVASLDNIEVFHRSVELGWIDQVEKLDKPSYTVLDAYIRYQPTADLRIDLAVQNLFDESYRNHGSVADYGQLGEEYNDYNGVVGIKEPGRDIRLTASFSF